MDRTGIDNCADDDDAADDTYDCCVTHELASYTSEFTHLGEDSVHFRKVTCLLQSFCTL